MFLTRHHPCHLPSERSSIPDLGRQHIRRPIGCLERGWSAAHATSLPPSHVRIHHLSGGHDLSLGHNMCHVAWAPHCNMLATLLSHNPARPNGRSARCPAHVTHARRLGRLDTRRDEWSIRLDPVLKVRKPVQHGAPRCCLGLCKATVPPVERRVRPVDLDIQGTHMHTTHTHTDYQHDWALLHVANNVVNKREGIPPDRCM